MSCALNRRGEPLSVTYWPWRGFWAGFLCWGFAIGTHSAAPGSLVWSWFALVLDRDLCRQMDRRILVTVAGRSLGLSWNWSPWSYPEAEWGWRSVFRPVRFVITREKLERYDRP